MYTIWVGAVLSVILGRFLGGVVFCIGIAITLIISLLPVQGYNERKLVKEIPLLPLKQHKANGECYYVEISEEKVTYAFDNKEAYGLSFEAYEQTAFSGTYKVYPNDKVEVPVLRIFETEPKRGDFTFALLGKKKEYVFVLPVGKAVDVEKTFTESKVV